LYVIGDIREIPQYRAFALLKHMENCIYIQLFGAKDEPSENVIALSERSLRRHPCQALHSIRTEQAYIGWIGRFIVFHGKRHPVEMGAAEVGEFLTHLAVTGNVAASTRNQALNALVFMYKAVFFWTSRWGTCRASFGQKNRGVYP
jgi:hypothetical protein